MHCYIVAGFGNTMPRNDLVWIYELGFDGVRTDANTVLDIALAQVKQLRRYDLRALLLFKPEKHSPGYVKDVVGNSQELARLRFSVELGNENNIGNYDTDRYLRWVEDSFVVGVETYAGSIHALVPEALDWARRVIPNLNVDVIPALHPYRSGSRGGTDLERFDEWRSLSQNGRFGITELGWHTGARPRRFPLCWRVNRWTDMDVGLFAAIERAHWQAAGATCLCWYQLNDGPGKDSESLFGIRRLDGSVKPAALVWERQP